MSAQQTTYNHLPKTLKNRYIIQRHGFSLANNDKLICSNPEIAIPPTGGPLGTGYGLHDKGKTQVREVYINQMAFFFRADIFI
ncbi:hypothetical protein BDF20DRAFT_823470 [Mycotypha africana]|uniref:uncharacterized protein n=1 Tax=Mycotypha africana TaxID=64632 RepID=UPI002300EC75|nr:uncharacterized protein BDF20DRAFT_823470 [Mycotypha africana]KAI8973539.1 hypothetical protein BDF20DRAFT_823470 [Mycotypha africana]